MPSTTGEPLRATTMRSGKSACRTAMPYVPSMGAAPRGPSPPGCRPAERAIRWASTSVSVSETKSTPSAASLARSSEALSMMPLWTTATLPSASRCGCAFVVVGGAVGGPAGVGDARGAGEPLGDAGLQLADPALGLDRLQAAGLPGPAVMAMPGGVVAPVLQPLQPFQQQRSDVTLADVSDDPAHRSLPLHRRTISSGARRVPLSRRRCGAAGGARAPAAPPRGAAARPRSARRSPC